MKQRSLNFTNSLAIRLGLNSGRVEVLGDKNIAGYPGNMFFHQRLSVYEIIDPVRRQQVLQFQAPDPRCICHFDIKIIVYFIVIVDDLDAEWFGIAKYAIIYPFYMQVLFCLCITAGFENRISSLKAMVYLFGYGWGVEYRFP